MYSKNLTFDAVELYTESTNHLSPVYVEASKSFSKVGGKGKEVLAAMFNTVRSKLRSKKKTQDDINITNSRGNINNYHNIKTIEDALSLLKGVKSAGAVSRDIYSIISYLRKNKHLYEKGYEKRSELIIFEYENSVYILLLAASLALAVYHRRDVDANGKIVNRSQSIGKHGGVIFKTISSLSKELNSKTHTKYLESILEISDQIPVDTKVGPKTESASGLFQDAMGLLTAIYGSLGKAAKFSFNVITGIWKTMFGILPLLRIITYLRLKHKANKIIRLEEEVRMIKDNISQLEKEKTKDPDKKKAIIIKQKAYIDAYNKKCEKLRAQLMDTEKEAVNAMEKNKSEIKEKAKPEVPGTKKDDKATKPSTPTLGDDFVLD